jgi:hypothetical protein
VNATLKTHTEFYLFQKCLQCFIFSTNCTIPVWLYMKVYPSFLFHVSSIFIHPPMLSPPSMFHPFLSVCITAERNLPSAPHQKHSIFVARSLLPSTQKKFHWSRRLVVTNRIFFPLVAMKHRMRYEKNLRKLLLF